jgi:nicotinamide mononucleotide transporter
MSTAAASTAATATGRTPWWGTDADRRAAAMAITAAYVAVTHRLDTGYTPTGLEVLGTVTSLACVWITRRQNVLCMPLGLVSVVAMGVFFFRIDLVGQGWLHLGYYVPVQVLGWWLWIRGGADRTDLPVSWLTARGRVALGAACVVGTIVLWRVFEHLHGPGDTLLWDTSIVAASVAAQALLTVKRIEAWWLWLVPVDVSAIALYVVSGAHLFAALYVLYLVLAGLGLREWTGSWRAQRAGLTALEARFAT